MFILIYSRFLVYNNFIGSTNYKGYKMNNELALLNKNLTDAKKDLQVAREAFQNDNSDAAFDSVQACYAEIGRLQDSIIKYLMNNK